MRDETPAGDDAPAQEDKSAIARFWQRTAWPVGASIAAMWHHPFSPERRKARVARIQAGWNRGPSYDDWIKSFDYDPARDRTALAAEVAAWPRQPLISVLMPTYNTPPEYLDAAIRSVSSQVYPHWELCIADDASPRPEVRAVLDAWRARDTRIKVAFRKANGHISAATNTAFSLASGDHVTMVDHDDRISENALAELARVFVAHPEAEIVYSDEDKIDVRDRRFDPHFKPDWSPDLLRSQNYINHLAAYRSERIRAVGGWREGFEGSQDYDLNLRICERIAPHSVFHIPKVLYHWRAVPGSTAFAGAEKSYAYVAGKRALEEHVARLGLGAVIEDIPGVPYYRTVYPLPSPPPRVSLIVPTRDQVAVLRACIESILAKTTYPDYEVLVLDNGSTEPEAQAYLRGLAGRANVRVIAYDAPFNYAAINNFAVRHAAGSVLGLINNDIEVIEGGWLTEMASHAVRPEIGCVGAKLYYPNDTLQHGGIILGLGGIAGHAHLDSPRSSSGYFGRLRVTRDVSAVTAACLVVRRSIYEAVGGLDEASLPVEFNDVDFCLKVLDAGYRNIWTPFAELYHHESVSRGRDSTSPRFLSAVETMRQRWGARLPADPYYSPNMALTWPDFSFRGR
jgi:glycosyltransferase involved in cell wall biosynthesis